MESASTHRAKEDSNAASPGPHVLCPGARARRLVHGRPRLGRRPACDLDQQGTGNAFSSVGQNLFGEPNPINERFTLQIVADPALVQDAQVTFESVADRPSLDRCVASSMDVR